MKKLISLFLTLFVASGVWAYQFLVDGIGYNIVNENEVSVTHNQYDEDTDLDVSNYSGDITIPSSVTYNGKSYRVTSIGEYAFYECTKLTSVSIPNSVTTIGREAFYGCTRLPSINIPNGVIAIGGYAFLNCISLQSIVIPESINKIEYGTFELCEGLTSITIPNSVDTIGEEAFYGCVGLTSISLPEGITICGSAFESCRGLKSITIPKNASVIGDVFSYNRLSSVRVSEGVSFTYDYDYSYKKPFYGNEIDTFYFDGTEPPIIYQVKEEYDKYEMTYYTSIVECEDCDLESLGAISWHTTIRVSCEALEAFKAKWPEIADQIFMKGPQVKEDRYCSVIVTPDCPNLIIEAVPGSGRKFVSWNDGNTSIRRVVAADDKVYEPIVERYVVTATAESPEQGTVDVHPEELGYDLSAHPNEGYYFVKWSDGNTNSYRYVSPESDESYVAIFAKLAEEETFKADVVSVEPDIQKAEFSLPITDDNVRSYVLTIKKDGDVFCTLTFNESGQLMEIDFSTEKSYTLKSGVKGHKFTVTGLSAKTSYTYSYVVYNYKDELIKEYTGSFVTKNADGSGGSAQGGKPNGDSTAVSEVSNATAVTIVNGQILVNGEAPAFVVTVSGQKIANANLKAGVYFVNVEGETVGVPVR
ncbi:MAG: leucine-rich repeat domain-containing protein [Bacteroidales bacterium]|nr:leucine-rich repeat domain-containing protein [Bacteroidales bacterium]